MKKILIGIAGRAQSGKTTCADILCDLLNLRAYTIALPVTQACAAALGMPHEDFMKLRKAEYLPGLESTKREFMQTMGDAILHRNPYALIYSLEARIKADSPCELLFNGQLITDIRTETEARWLRGKGGTLVHIQREPTESTEHRTEQKLQVLPQDIRLKNEDNQLEMYRQKCELLAQHLETRLDMAS